MPEHQGLDVSPCRRLPDDLKAHVSLRRLSRAALLLSGRHGLPLTGFDKRTALVLPLGLGPMCQA